MPGGEQILSGPVVLILQFLRWVVPALAVLLAFDALRRPERHFVGRFQRVAKWSWILPQLAFVLLVLIGLSLPSSMAAAVAALLGAFVAFGLQIAYLLRVAFPTPARLEKRRAAAESAHAAAADAAGPSDHPRPTDHEER